MPRTTALECAKFFIQNNSDTKADTFDGRMKLQHLLLFADLIHLANRNEPLFNDPICAIKYGCVVEAVQERFADYAAFVDKCEWSKVVCNESELRTLCLADEIYGNASAKELAQIVFSFNFWQKAPNVVRVADMLDVSQYIKRVLAAHEQDEKDNDVLDVINGIKFRYAPDFEITDEIFTKMYELSLSPDDDSYYVCRMGGELVVY